MRKNNGGSLDFNGQNNADKHDRSLSQYDYNQSRLKPKETGTATNHVGNMGGLGDINGKQAVVSGGVARPTKAASTVGRGPTKGNE